MTHLHPDGPSKAPVDPCPATTPFARRGHLTAAGPPDLAGAIRQEMTGSSRKDRGSPIRQKSFAGFIGGASGPDMGTPQFTLDPSFFQVHPKGLETSMFPSL